MNNNQDKKLIAACTKKDVSGLFGTPACEHPMDGDIISRLTALGNKIRCEDDDYELFRYRKEVDELWGKLLEKAVKCLRYNDTREPFSTDTGQGEERKNPKAYGIDDLKQYYRKYAEFEKILYGSSRYYRDHVIHVFRTWLSGVALLVKNGGAALKKISIQDKAIPIKINEVEKISIWTIVSLTHDLGYPLEKAKDIISITQDMLSSFIANPDISADFSYHGVQNYMNDYIVRLMSSKMEKKTGRDEKTPYVARLQSKYYFKFQKSLERNNHGILSTLIIYKLLTYFLESDYNVQEDYAFSEEECRQFYIRREILRAIAAHTCDDIYQMYMGSFAFLLRICDDTQEWGRKNISELYVKAGQEYELQDIELSFGEDPKQMANKCTVREKLELPDRDSAVRVIDRFRKQALVYVTIFRDGQDTNSRDFSFERCLTIAVDDVTIELTLNVDKNKASQLQGTVSLTSDEEKNKPFGKKFGNMLDEKMSVQCQYDLLDADKKPTSKAEHCRSATLIIPLTN